MKLPAFACLLLLGAALCGCAPPASVPIAGASAAGSFATRLGESSHLGGRVVTPLAILEDSRCPDGVQCIQAGTVRLQVRVQGGPRDGVAAVGFGSPADMGGAWLHLASACPYPQLSRPIAPADYRLTFLISDSPAPPAAPIACAGR